MDLPVYTYSIKPETWLDSDPETQWQFGYEIYQSQTQRFKEHCSSMPITWYTSLHKQLHFHVWGLHSLKSCLLIKSYGICSLYMNQNKAFFGKMFYLLILLDGWEMDFILQSVVSSFFA